MPTLSLTSLVDIVSKSGTPKATCVRDVKAQMSAPYDPATDYYRGIREAIIEAHVNGLGKRHISTAANAANFRRAATYTQLAADYNGWWGRKSIAYFDPPRATWQPPGLFEVNVNPELGLEINGTQHVIKLYFKSDAITKARVDIITHLMQQELSSPGTAYEFSVLDIRRRRLHTITPPSGLGPLLIAELAYVAALWPSV